MFTVLASITGLASVTGTDWAVRRAAQKTVDAVTSLNKDISPEQKVDVYMKSLEEAHKTARTTNVWNSPFFNELLKSLDYTNKETSNKNLPSSSQQSTNDNSDDFDF